MYPAVSVMLCDLLVVQVWGGRKPLIPRLHPNVTSGDLLDYSDYSIPITPSSEKLPCYIKHDSHQNVVVMFTMFFGDDNKIIKASNDSLIITKTKDPEANLEEIWHIHKEDIELKQFFAKVLSVDPVHVTVVHIAFSKKESTKKLLIKESVMKATDVFAKLEAAEGKVISDKA